MTEPIFTPANLVDHRDALLALNIEYAAWAVPEMEAFFGINLQASLGMPVAEYVASMLDTICGEPPPRKPLPRRVPT